MAKNSASNGAKNNKKNKSKRLNKLSKASMKSKEPKDNPFESMWSRRKFNILGKKRKDDERRRIGLSRSLAIQKRQKTLLKEYEQSLKSSVFVDKRIGEQTEGLEEFDKAIMRSQRERQLKLKKKSKFNLSDGEEDDLDIQDSGYFAERDDYEDEDPRDEDDVDQTFGGEEKLSFDPQRAEDGDSRYMEDQESRPKSKKEVMEDIILKSKFFKAQKAKDKEEYELHNEELDKQFASLVQSGKISSLTDPEKMRALKALVNKNIPNDNLKKEETNKTENKSPLHQEKPNYYDELVGEMALDMRGKPSDRTKTPEEIAQDEKEHLEKLEAERQKRMAADNDTSSNEDSSSEDEDNDSRKRIKHISGDDLGDSFSHEAPSKTKVAWIQEVLKQESDDELESEDDDGSEESDEDHDGIAVASSSLKDWEQSDDENIGVDLEDEEEDSVDEDEETEDKDGDSFDEKADVLSKSRRKEKDSADANKTKTKSNSEKELPYTIEAPKSFEELNSLFENLSDDQVLEAIRRVRTFNAISIAAENRKKMQVFYGLLLQYFAVSANKKPLNFALLNMLVKPLIEMSAEIPYFAAICARQRLLRTRTQFCEDVKNRGKSCWPSLKTILLLRIWSMIFPCSDFRHAVMTPAILLMCEYLMRCPIISGKDIAIGSFLCSMVLSVTRQSQKFCPEAVTFVQTMLLAALSNKQKYETSQLYHLMEVRTIGSLLCVQSRVEEINPLDFLSLMDFPDDSPYFSSDNFRVSVLSSLVGNLKGFVSVYGELKSFPEIFSPALEMLRGLAQEDHLPDALKAEIKELSQIIESKTEEFHLLRQPLKLRKQKIIQTSVPKFEDNFVKGRDYDPDRERVERKKLKKRMKQEAKGAVRELRKDNFFLLEVKDKEKARLEEEKAEKYGKYRAFLQEQEHAFKSGQLGKSKKRRR